MSTPEKSQQSVNPPHDAPLRKDSDAEKAALYRYHNAAGSLGDYYELFPMDRLPEPEPRQRCSGGRSR